MKKSVLFAAVLALAAAVACGDGSQPPAAPSPAPTSIDADAGADGSTLKVNPPTHVSPGNGATLDTFGPTLTVQQVTAKFTDAGPFAVRFQLLGANNAVIREFRTSGTTWPLDVNLEPDTVYSWRARGEQGSFFGPWSTAWTFRTPNRPQGYIRGSEVYDPLTTGTTIGNIVGPVTFIPNVGIKLEDFTSHVRYELGETLTGGEFSILVTGVPDNTEGGKTKLMSMSEGFSDITTNDRRFTLERRGDPFGIVAWRIITRDDEVSTEGVAERRYVQFSANQVYLIRSQWGNNVITITMYEGGAGGREIYRFSKHYDGVYDPSPHFAYIGAPVGRGGAVDATIPGMIVRQVWISRNPRPSFANQ